jgi:hypothetical protein
MCANGEATILVFAADVVRAGGDCVAGEAALAGAGGGDGGAATPVLKVEAVAEGGDGGELDEGAPADGVVGISNVANAATSSGLSTVTMMGSPTFSSAGPACARIFATTPSSCASKSTVALSVSTLQKMSPAANLSPSFKFQLAMEPDSIVYTRRTGRAESSNSTEKAAAQKIPTVWTRLLSGGEGGTQIDTVTYRG